jgi:hypothetical protein
MMKARRISALLSAFNISPARMPEMLIKIKYSNRPEELNGLRTVFYSEKHFISSE